MARAVEAIIDEANRVRLLEPVPLEREHRALVIVLDEAPSVTVSETALLSEGALGEDWNRPGEDAAWAYLDQAV